jgi:uncharacterized protein
MLEKLAAGGGETVLRELERLKSRVVQAGRAGDRSRQVSFLYRSAERFSRRVFAGSFCRTEMSPETGCTTGCCCKCSPDVFAHEKQVLELLPSRVDQSGYCPFFNLGKRTCGIYGVRPFACRIYYNFGTSRYYCQNPTDSTLQFFDGLKRHLEQILGPYAGGFRP